MKELAVKVEHVSKQYRYGLIGGKTLGSEMKEKLDSLFHRSEKSGDGKKKEKFYALDDISFEVGKGEKLAIIGGNGAGKSTLLRLIARITAPTSGDIYLNGRISSILQIGTGFHAELTGRENIYLNGTILGMTKNEINKKMDDIIAFSECEEFIDTPVKRYSSGMFVKLAFSVAVNLDNDILIMDEVLAVGDVRFQQKCLAKLNEIAAQDGRTILFVSHNMNSVRQLCPRSVVLKKGKLIFDGDTAEAIEYYMNINRSGSESFYSYTSENRIGRLVMPTAIKSAEILPREGEIIPVRIALEPTEDAESARLCFVICSSDNMPIGTVTSESPLRLEKGKPQSALCRIDVSHLQEGVYSVNISLFAGVGSRKLGLDRVNGAFLLHIEREGDPRMLNPSMFGSVIFPDAATEAENSN